MSCDDCVEAALRRSLPTKSVPSEEQMKEVLGSTPENLLKDFSSVSCIESGKEDGTGILKHIRMDGETKAFIVKV